MTAKRKNVIVRVYKLSMLYTPKGWIQSSMQELGTVSLPVDWTVRNLYRELRKNGWLTIDHPNLVDTTEWDMGYELCRRSGQPLLFVREEEAAA